MTGGDGAATDFDRVVCILERRARFELRRWARMGSSHIRVTRGGRIKDDELRKRFTRLRQAAEGLASRIDSVLGDAPAVEVFIVARAGQLLIREERIGGDSHPLCVRDVANSVVVRG